MMEIELTVAQRSPAWYWAPSDINADKNYYEEWQALNEDKVQKHVHALKFEIKATDIRENRKAR